MGLKIQLQNIKRLKSKGLLYSTVKCTENALNNTSICPAKIFLKTDIHRWKIIADLNFNRDINIQTSFKL